MILLKLKKYQIMNASRYIVLSALLANIIKDKLVLNIVQFLS